MKLGKLFGKIIESEDKKTRGTILGICCADGLIDGYICFDERENEFFVSAKNARFKRGIMTFDLKDKKRPDGANLKLGGAVFSCRGKFLGLLKEVTARKNVLEYAEIGGSAYPFKRLVFGDVIILKDGEECAKDMFIGAICGEL